MKQQSIIGIFAALLAAGAAYVQALVAPLVVLLCAMTVDYITGMIHAWITAAISSRTGIKGIIKKLCYLFAVAVGIVVDWIIKAAGVEAGISIQNFHYIALLVTIWLILNEAISILENVSAIGVPVPAFLKKIVEKLKTNTDKEGEKL